MLPGLRKISSGSASPGEGCQARLHVRRQGLTDVSSVVNENTYFQPATRAQPGCQIDFMIQARFSCLYVCEMCFSSRPIGTEIVREVQEKIDRLKRPKHFSCRPVLIHISGVTSGARRE